MDREQRFHDKVKKLYDQQTLDQATAARLRDAAWRALDAQPGRPRKTWAVVTICASFVLVVTLVWLVRPLDRIPLDEADELAIIYSEDALELYQELEFYLWLEDESKA